MCKTASSQFGLAFKEDSCHAACLVGTYQGAFNSTGDALYPRSRRLALDEQSQDPGELHTGGGLERNSHNADLAALSPR